ncbi:YD repeat-containing protein [Aquimarina sp. MAR_2010_214]|uniref:RHS repeat domain-containing protein n=1 Tax=Aquimarina sp. MAR_2010_214 TaxID=1250026 RepID=UPI000C6FF872|nr:RHS repeat domain-containing protein [Aquimarina sp. MAR_2010_214]PKV49570.1 YD repeat-containing protein [Aquimarina sp. MAR_2010_214]
MKNITIVLFFFCCSFYAQEFTPDYIEYHAKYTPETPNASTFTIYGNTPVNHATGVPKIDIPLFTIEEDGMSVPISLSYHASGVKVDDLSSVVGLKWTLNAGGGIFRQVNDNPDETGWLQANSRGFVTPDWIAAQGRIDVWETQQLIGHSDKYKDYYPDDYNYTFLNHSGAFIFNQDGTIQEEKESALFFEKNSGVDNSFYFKAHDGYGARYHFNNDNIESNGKHILFASDAGGLSLNREGSVTGWMLNKLVTKNNKQINFAYTPYTLEYEITNASNSLNVAPGCVETSPQCGCSGTGIISKTSVSSTAVRYTSVNQLISTIESSNIKVSFNYTEDATLSNWKKQLNSIIVLDKIANKTKSYTFTYSKFPGDSRLRLDQIQEIGFDHLTKPAYKFYYEAGSLPALGSMSKDFHGYYNGKSNTSLVPYSVAAYRTITPTYRARLADRREDLSYLKIGTLRKIEYPTGGSTTFTYEANAVPSTTNDNPVYVTKYASALASSAYTISGDYRVFKGEFKVRKDLESSGTPVTYTGSSDICNFDPLEPSIDCSQFNIYPKHSDGSLGTPVFSPFKVIGVNGSIILPKGDYVLELKVEEAKLVANPTALISVNLSWDEQEITAKSTHYVGGLRVKSVIDKDINDAITKQTQYSYKGLTGHSLNVNNTTKGYGESTVFSSDNIGINPALIKSGYFYDQVTIDQIGTDDRIRTIEYYSEAFRNKSYASQLVKQELYKENNKVRDIVYTHDNTITKTLQFWTLSDKVLCFTPAGTDNTVLGYTNPNSTNYYHRRDVLSKKTQIDYHSKPGEPFNASVTQYKYEYNDNVQVIKEELDGRLYAESEQAIVDNNYSIVPDGRHVEIRYTYPKDHQSENTTIAALHNNHQTSLPVSKKVYANGDLIQGQFMNYDTQGNVIATYKHHKGQSTYQPAVGHIPSDYELYQEFKLEAGKPIEVQRKDGLPIAILWDTTHTYVLAQLIGVTKTELEGVSGAVNLKTTTDSQLNTLYSNLRNTFTNGQITTFIHEPLKGVVQATDARGYTTQYDYDGLSRLISVKDADNHLISENKYHYKNQQ